MFLTMTEVDFRKIFPISFKTVDLNGHRVEDQGTDESIDVPLPALDFLFGILPGRFSHGRPFTRIIDLSITKIFL